MKERDAVAFTPQVAVLSDPAAVTELKTDAYALTERQRRRFPNPSSRVLFRIILDSGIRDRLDSSGLFRIRLEPDIPAFFLLNP